MLRAYTNGKLEPVRVVSATPYAEMHADVITDGSDRLWIAWEEAGINWGKDEGYANPKHGIHLKEGGTGIYGNGWMGDGARRKPRLAVLDGTGLKQPRPQLQQALSGHLRGELFQNPRLGIDGQGKVWVFLRHQHAARGFYVGHLFDFYATSLNMQGSRLSWANPILLPASTGRQDTVLASAPGPGGRIVAAVAGDGRRLPIGLPIHSDIAALVIDGATFGRAEPELATFEPSPAGEFAVPHPKEEAEVARVRGHRIHVAGKTYKIMRGDLHLHTEISFDGGVDGSLWDCYRYALNGADLDFIGITDHNYGAWLDTGEPEDPDVDNEYQWWRSQKGADLFHVPGRFVPLYGYERSVSFPLGHRNIFHARRGVFSLGVPELNIAEHPELMEADAQMLWSYLRQTDGLGIPHTSATVMGTDWRLREDELMPITEIYQGDRSSYEEEGAPRAALADNPGRGSAGLPPFQKGLIRNALGVGYKMGFIASSDHFSSHISYANLLVPEGATSREDLQESMRRRRTYASTDNIVVDFRTETTLQGGELHATESPHFEVEVVGTASLLKVEIIKNNRIVYTRSPEANASNPQRMKFTFQDLKAFGGDFRDTSMSPTTQIKDWSQPETGIRARPDSGMSYYYVRVLQSFSSDEPSKEGEIAWSSPIFVHWAGDRAAPQ